MAQFQDLPDEVLSRILAFTSLLDTTRSKVVCKHLKRVCDGQFSQDMSELHVCASAGSTLPKLQDAIEDAARRACQGMQGGVDVAVLLVAGYASQRRLDASSNTLRQAGPAALLQKYLPRGVPVIGCTSDGIMSVGSESEVLEVDPQERRSRNASGVALLLMRAPGYELRPFVDSHGLSKETPMAPADSFIRWVHAPAHTPAARDATHADNATSDDKAQHAGDKATDAPGDCKMSVDQQQVTDQAVAGQDTLLDGLQPKMVWLLPTQAYMATLQQMFMVEGVPGAYFRKQDLMSWIPRTYENDVVVAGGIPAGPLPQIFFAPGDGPGGAAHPDWKVAALKKAQFVGLAVCRKVNQTQQATNTHHQVDVVGSTAAEGCSHGSVHSLARQGLKDGVDGDVCAAAGAFLGLGPYYPTAEGYSCLYSDIEVSLMHEGGSAHIHLSCPATHRPGRGSAFWLSLHTFIESMDRGPYSHLAIWRHDGPPGSEAQLTQDVINSDHCVMLSLEERLRSLALFDCSLDLEPCTQDMQDRIKRISRDGASRVRVQLVAANGLGCNRQLPHLLHVLDRCCSRPTAGTTMNKQQLYIEVLEHLSKHAQANGARSGPYAAAVFSCNGRGSALYVDSDFKPTITQKNPSSNASSRNSDDTGTQTLLSEACILDETMGRRVPFIGGFFGGEIGPEFADTLPSPWTSVAINQGALHNLQRANEHLQAVDDFSTETAGTQQRDGGDNVVPGLVHAGLQQLQVGGGIRSIEGSTTTGDGQGTSDNSPADDAQLGHEQGPISNNTEASSKTRVTIQDYRHIPCSPWREGLDDDDVGTSPSSDDEADEGDDRPNTDEKRKGAPQRKGLRIGQTVFPHCSSVLQGYTSMYAMFS